MDKIDEKILEAILPFLKPYLDQFYKLDRFSLQDNEIVISGIEKKDSISGTRIIRIVINHEHRQVFIPNIFMPPFMKHKRIGKTLIHLIYQTSKTNDYELFIADLVPGFYMRLVKRGATIIEDNEMVQITDETDLIGSGYA